MAWDKKSINLGVVKFKDNTVQVYYDTSSGSFTGMSFREKVKNAYWSGDSVIVVTETSTIRCHGQHENERTSF